jgi:hypothetical protein
MADGSSGGGPEVTQPPRNPNRLTDEETSDRLYLLQEASDRLTVSSTPEEVASICQDIDGKGDEFWSPFILDQFNPDPERAEFDLFGTFGLRPDSAFNVTSENRRGYRQHQIDMFIEETLTQFKEGKIPFSALVMLFRFKQFFDELSQGLTPEQLRIAKGEKYSTTQPSGSRVEEDTILNGLTPMDWQKALAGSDYGQRYDDTLLPMYDKLRMLFYAADGFTQFNATGILERVDVGEVDPKRLIENSQNLKKVTGQLSDYYKSTKAFNDTQKSMPFSPWCIPIKRTVRLKATELVNRQREA